MNITIKLIKHDYDLVKHITHGSPEAYLLKTIKTMIKNSREVAPEFIASLKKCPDYKNINVDYQISEIKKYISDNHSYNRMFTKKFVIQWLNRVAKQVTKQAAKKFKS